MLITEGKYCNVTLVLKGGGDMILKDLIKSVNNDKVWEVLNREYNHKEGAYEAYKKVIEELKSLKPKLSKPEVTLVVAKVKDGIEPDKLIFDVFGIKEGDEEHYGLVMVPWEEWLGLNVLTKSVEKYGAAEVVAHALYEMTFFGYSAEAASKRVAEEKRILDEQEEEIKGGKAQFIPFEEVMAELGIVDKRTPEEKEEQQKEFERITAENEKIYKELLGTKE